MIEKERTAAVVERQAIVARAKDVTAQELAQQKGELEAQVVAARAAIVTEAEQLADKITANILKV